MPFATTWIIHMILGRFRLLRDFFWLFPLHPAPPLLTVLVTNSYDNFTPLQSIRMFQVWDNYRAGN